MDFCVQEMRSLLPGLLPRLLPVLFFFLLMAGCADNRDALLLQAGERLEANAADEARELYHTLLARDSFDIDAIQGMVHVTQATHAIDEHVLWCEKLLTLVPWDRHANLIVGQKQQAEGNLKDAAVRYMLAYQSSDFQDEKKEILDLLTRLKQLEMEAAQREAGK
jgi:hypothetical protein